MRDNTRRVIWCVSLLLLLCAAGGCASQARGPRVITIEGHRAEAEAGETIRAMKYLPFDVPRGVTSIRIQPQIMWNSDPKGVVDHGLFDARGIHPDGRGFRGWQGGAVGDIMVGGTAQATGPHYIAGAIPAGEWNIAQSFLRSPPGGFGYKYTITMRFDGLSPPAEMPAVPVYRPGAPSTEPRWYVGNLHTHSIHSDGALPLEQVVALNEKHGYQFIAATDHNSNRQHWEVAAAGAAHPHMLILFGEEITTPFGHSNVIGIEPGAWFDFRMDGGDGQYPMQVAEAHRQGGLIQANHPFTPCLTCMWRFPEAEWAGIDAIEVWNGGFTPDDRLAIDLWDRQLKAGRRIKAVGGSDFHKPGDPLVPAVFVHAGELSRDAIIDSLRRGRSFISHSPQGPMLLLSDSAGSAICGDTITPSADGTIRLKLRVQGAAGQVLRIIWNDGQARHDIASDDVTIEHTAAPGGLPSYVRAELLKTNGEITALTNPIYVQPNGP